ncbi:MAG: PhoX family protein [Methylophagaceae bacterium]
MKTGLGGVLASILNAPLLAKTVLNKSVHQALLGFSSVSIADLIDNVVVPEGYSAQIFYRWGDPISNGPLFKMDASNTAQEQLQQAGMHHDALQFYPLPMLSRCVERGLLVMNHEYIDAQVLHADGGVLDSLDSYTAEKMLKEQYAHGVSVIEIKKENGAWDIVRPSHYARRITATTPMRVSGPVAGTHFIQTKADPNGQEILGTFNNCSNGKTPWGTYLTCEENFHDYFHVSTKKKLSKKQKKAWKRYAIKHSYYGWHHHDERFDASQHPNETNRFGWIVEFDPLDPESQPIKRTAMGRYAHENVAHKITKDGRVAFYSGDDARFEYVYKFITKQQWDGSQGAQHGQLLDEGVLYAARFDEAGKGEWLPLIYGHDGLTKEKGFESQADILVHARMAADVVGATPMDRPEWVTVHPDTGEVFVSMTNNSKRGDKGKPQYDAANPRKNNHFGHIMRLREEDAASIVFHWDVFALAGDGESGATVNGDIYANPDGLMIDNRGVLWVQTDISSSKLNTDRFAQFGNNQMLAVDPRTGETRRFLTGPIGCEVTGVVMTPDLKTMWVNIQHPGEEVPAVMQARGIKKSPSNPNAASNWPDHQKEGRPRSATVMITKDDGGIIGA